MTSLPITKPLRAALYARYSTDLQSASSITDQITQCKKLCADNGWMVVGVFSDETRSGTT